MLIYVPACPHQYLGCHFLASTCALGRKDCLTFQVVVIFYANSQADYCQLIMPLRPLLLSQPRNSEESSVITKDSSTMKGSYILLIRLPEEQTIRIDSRQNMYFSGGYYAYVGSAMGGFRARLNRHLKGNKRPHWHIDYLLSKAFIREIILCEANNRLECTIAQALSHQFDSIPGFGSSDCKCKSHLFFAADEMKSTILAILNRLDVKQRQASL